MMMGDDEIWHSTSKIAGIGNEVWLAGSVHWFMEAGQKVEVGREFSQIYRSVCAQIIHQSIRLEELNPLQFTAKLYVQR